jgi:hypothetical protein
VQHLDRLLAHPVTPVQVARFDHRSVRHTASTSPGARRWQLRRSGGQVPREKDQGPNRHFSIGTSGPPAGAPIDRPGGRPGPQAATPQLNYGISSINSPSPTRTRFLTDLGGNSTRAWGPSRGKLRKARCIARTTPESFRRMHPNRPDVNTCEQVMGPQLTDNEQLPMLIHKILTTCSLSMSYVKKSLTYPECRVFLFPVL